MALLVWNSWSRQNAERWDLEPAIVATGQPDSPIESAAIAPDGKTISYSDPQGIHLHTVATGVNRLLAGSQGLQVGGWSGDSSALHAAKVGADGKVQSWSIPVAGGSPTRSFDAVVVVSTDQRFALMNRDWEGWIKNADGTNVCKTVSSSDWFGSWASWSSDSHTVAIVYDGGTPPGSELVLSRAENNGPLGSGNCPSAILVALPGGIRPTRLSGVTWAGDNRLLYAQTDYAKTSSSVWALNVNTNKLSAASPPSRKLLMPGSVIQSISASVDGNTAVISTLDGTLQLYVGELDDAGRSMRQPRRFFEEQRTAAVETWSRDSSKLFISSDHDGQWRMFQRSLDSEPAGVMADGSKHQSCGRVSPDGKWLLYATDSEDQSADRVPTRIMRVPLAGGPSEEVLTPRGRMIGYDCASISTGLCVLTEHDGLRVITLFDPIKGRVREVLREPGSFMPAHMSPDGRELAWLTTLDGRSGVRIVRLDGSEQQTFAVPGALALRSLEWAADSSGFYGAEVLGTAGRLYDSSYLFDENSLFGAATLRSDGSRFRLRRIERGGESSVIWSGNALWAKPSPDGKRLAMTVGHYATTLWQLKTSR